MAKAFLYRSIQRTTTQQFFLDAGENQHIGINRQSYRKNKPSNAGQRQRHRNKFVHRIGDQRVDDQRDVGD